MARKQAVASIQAEPLQHDDEFPLDTEELVQDLEERTSDSVAAAANTEPWRATVESIQGEMAALRRENEQLRRAIPTAQPAQNKKDLEEPDWDKLLFDNPREALKLHGERVAADVESRLTARYQRDQGTKNFWNDFYGKYPDLREDHDLVQQTLETNFADLGTLSIPQALQKLSVLTRDRILRYSGKGRNPNRRVLVEGAGPALPKRVQAEPSKISTLGDLIRANRKRRAAAV